MCWQPELLPVPNRQTGAFHRWRWGQGSLQDDPNHRSLRGSSCRLHHCRAGTHVLLQKEAQRQKTAEGPGRRGAWDGVSQWYVWWRTVLMVCGQAGRYCPNFKALKALFESLRIFAAISWLWWVLHLTCKMPQVQIQCEETVGGVCQSH